VINIVKKNYSIFISILMGIFFGYFVVIGGTMMSVITIILFGAIFLSFFVILPRPEICLYAVIFFAPLDIYRVVISPGINISLYRIFLVFAIFIYGLLLINKGFKMQKQPLYIFLIFYGMSVIFSFSLTSNFSWAMSVLLANLSGVIIVYLMAELLNTKQKIYTAAMVYCFSLVFSVLGAIYILRQFFEGLYVTDIPFRNALPFTLASAGHLAARSRFLGFPRFALPLTSPPHLGASLNIGILFLFCTFILYRNQKAKLKNISVLIFLSLLCLVLLGTFARSAWIGLLGGGVVILIVEKGRLLFNKRFWGFSFIVVLVLGMVFFFRIFSPSLVLKRFSPEITTRTNEYHLETRLEALRIATTNIKNLLFGVGLGNYGLYAPSGGIGSHSVYTTILAERGLFGLCIFLVLVISVFFKSRKLLSLSKIKDRWYYCRLGFLSAWVAILLGSLLYEFFYCKYVWFLLGLVIAGTNVDRVESKVQE